MFSYILLNHNFAYYCSNSSEVNDMEVFVKSMCYACRRRNVPAKVSYKSIFYPDTPKDLKILVTTGFDE
jgi:hypothetical protein